jgi:dCMP deaminase
MSTTHKRPGWDEYYMGIAMAVRKRANCTGNRVGAIIVHNARVIATGYNGTPQGVKNCEDGGCDRCFNRDKYPSGQGYDLCICVHAEQNAILMAAKTGIAVDGGTLYSTMRPCFGCAKECIQVGIRKVVYLHDWRYPDDAMRAAYENLLTHFKEGCVGIDLVDPDYEWAVRAARK